MGRCLEPLELWHCHGVWWCDFGLGVEKNLGTFYMIFLRVHKINLGRQNWFLATLQDVRYTCVINMHSVQKKSPFFMEQRTTSSRPIDSRNIRNAPVQFGWAFRSTPKQQVRCYQRWKSQTTHCFCSRVGQSLLIYWFAMRKSKHKFIRLAIFARLLAEQNNQAPWVDSCKSAVDECVISPCPFVSRCSTFVRVGF